MKVRIDKLEKLSNFTEVYPDRFESSNEIEEVQYLKDGTTNISVAGRITALRKMGSLSFITISDIKGKIQIAVKKNIIGEEEYSYFKELFDLGDFIGANGEMFTTNTGEKTIRANQIVFLGKALRPQPEKYHGLVNTELRYRERYLDLTTNLDTRDKFLKRIKFIKEVRRYLEEKDYLEIETPIMSNHASGALAKPFTSYHNALDQNIYLRIAPETYLKRAIVGGFTKVFEFARCFRNEGIDTTHLQDFTMLEGYCSYQNYKDSMEFLKKMLQEVIYKVWGSYQITLGNNIIDFSSEWKIYSFRDLIVQDCGIDINLYKTSESLLDEILKQGVGLDVTDEVKRLGRGNLIDLLYKKVSRPKIIQPTFLIEHPTDLSPLARTNDCDTEIADRFQLVINGSEIINAYSELVDPIEQRKRLIQQASDRSNGDEEAMMMDEDYLRAMEYGMPPISGWGIGIDRIMQVLTNSDNIKDVVLFPLLKAK